MKCKIKNLINDMCCRLRATGNRGMTYVELIVVLSIFAIMTSIVMFNYGSFQAKVDIKVLANDIALQIVQAQKDAMSGKWTSGVGASWKPAYGVYFAKNNEKQFIYFANNNDKFYDPNTDISYPPILINKNNMIDKLNYCTADINGDSHANLAIVFTRPNSGASFAIDGSVDTTINCVKIKIAAPDTNPATSCIEVYASGRVQITNCQQQP